MTGNGEQSDAYGPLVWSALKTIQEPVHDLPPRFVSHFYKKLSNAGEADGVLQHLTPR